MSENIRLNRKMQFSGLILLICLPLQGQLTSLKDTIKINEVIISGNKPSEKLKGFKTTLIDSSVMWNYSDESIANLLSENSGIFIKSYGISGSATPSFRGTGAGHTQLQWNNININNPMLGQPDLSLVPAGLIDEVEISYGGSSISTGTGGIGGIVNLENKPLWRNGSIISLSPAIGSFGRYSGLLKVRTGNLNFQSSTKAYLSVAENNFKYINDVQTAEPVQEEMINSESMQKGFLQEFYYKKSKDILSARLWYQFADRNLPFSMLMPRSSLSENQIDESFRTMLNYDSHIGVSEFFVTGAFSLSKLNYVNQLALIDSRNRSESMSFKAGFTNRIGDYVKTKFILENEHIQVRTENYSDNKALRNVSSLTSMAEINSSSRLGATVLLKEVLNGNSFLIPDFSAGLQWKITEADEYLLKANFSRNSKLPSMNDLFWVPGGNSELLDESALTYELTYEMAHQFSIPFKSKFDVTLYHNSIHNLIQWRPGIYSYWEAENVKDVNTSGIESAAFFEYITDRVTSFVKLAYTYTNATTIGSVLPNDESLGKQLVYVPEHQANAMMRFIFKSTYADWKTGYTGRRYTTTDNSSFLPGFVLHSLSSGYMLHRRSNILNFCITIDNLFNTSYQAIAYYPQPGRTYSLKLLIQITK
ncbi:MAG: TonB-dependent receptor [Bacteroidetes bacterium]|nr:TonB-dependent receptor [Bacteroidota bacterium]